jgi:hypothetical protein
MIHTQRAILIVVCGLLVGCHPLVPTFKWSVTTTDRFGVWISVPVTPGTASGPSTASVDPTRNFQVKLVADSPGGISAMTLTGTGDVFCQARVSAEQGSPTKEFQDTALALGEVNETVRPPTTPHSALLNFTKQDTVQDMGVIRCSPNLETVNGTTSRYYDAWSGTLTFSGSASNAATPHGVSTTLYVHLVPPAS